MAVPTAIVRFLESDTNTKIVAKPQLRGTEGAKLTMNLGSEVPVITTSYTPIATGGAGVNPLNSVQYRPVGINVEILPRFSLEGDILIEMTLESSALGANVSVGGTDYPTFASRRVTTKLRLRDGEANLLAGLLREDERKSLSGFPGAIHVPILKQLFSNNDETIQQTDIVMLLTPHIIRTPGITAGDLQPVYIGTQANIGLGGPPPIISLPGDQPAAGPAAAAPAPQPARVPSRRRLVHRRPGSRFSRRVSPFRRGHRRCQGRSRHRRRSRRRRPFRRPNRKRSRSPLRRLLQRRRPLPRRLQCRLNR